jgi:hypothetical protein
VAVYTIPQQNYTVGASPYNFGPFDAPEPINKIEIVADIPTADYQSAGAGFVCDVQASEDGFVTSHGCVYAWSNPNGGQIVSSKDGTINPAPKASCTYDPPLSPEGGQVKATFSVKKNMRVGFTVTTS